MRIMESLWSELNKYYPLKHPPELVLPYELHSLKIYDAYMEEAKIKHSLELPTIATTLQFDLPEVKID